MKLVDSDILIAHLRGVPAARAWLEDARRETGPLAISAITITEVAGGMRSGERREVNRLLATMRRFPVSEQIAWRAARPHAHVPTLSPGDRPGRLPDSGHRARRGPGASHPQREALPDVPRPREAV